MLHIIIVLGGQVGVGGDKIRGGGQNKGGDQIHYDTVSTCALRILNFNYASTMNMCTRRWLHFGKLNSEIAAAMKMW